MAGRVLWKRLTETDFNAMHAEASPFGAGGGARHIALGVRKSSFPIDNFLSAPGVSAASVKAFSSKFSAAKLDFYSNPNRRGGEWTIRNQYSNRHPAWSSAEGFPAQYDAGNPPYILLFRIDHSFYARFATEDNLKQLPGVPAIMLNEPRGIASASPEFLAAFGIRTLIQAFEAQEKAGIDEEKFDPRNIEDGRQRVFAAIMRRQGQPAFRKALLHAYSNRCAITRSQAVWVLEAAHITPYKGAQTNTPQNGLLLRADVHTLFDLGLVSVDPFYRIIKVSKQLKKTNYWELNDRRLLSPKSKIYRPSEVALQQHFAQFQD